VESGNDAAADALIFDYRKAELSHGDRALCDYALKLTLHPGDVDLEEIQKLREAGFSDEEISIATQVIGYFNYINRIADGLGVDPEEWMKLPLEEWKRRKVSAEEWRRSL